MSGNNDYAALNNSNIDNQEHIPNTGYEESKKSQNEVNSKCCLCVSIKPGF